MNPAVCGIGPIPVANGEIGLDAVLSCARQNLVTIAVVAFAFEMGVRVDEHSRWPFVDGRWRNRVATGAVARPGRAKLGSGWGRTPGVPPGLDSLVPLSPALKRWAKLVRPSGACILVRVVVPWRRNSSFPPPQQRYFSLVPMGTSSRKLASTGFPPSGEAATIMPLDSSPRSLRGARLATITTLRPISVSGS